MMERQAPVDDAQRIGVFTASERRAQIASTDEFVLAPR
jgi:hypothetical protein